MSKNKTNRASGEKSGSRTGILITVIAVVFAVFVGALLFVANIDKFRNYTTIAFYRVPEAQVQVISSELQSLTNEKGKPLPYKFIVLNPEEELSGQLKRSFDAVITLQGTSTLIAQDKVAANKQESIFYTEQIIDGLTISMAQTVQKTDTGLISAVPILQDIYEADILVENLTESGMECITTWEELKDFAATGKGIAASPITFAGGDSTTLINLLGVLTEALEGSEAYTEKSSRVKAVFQGNDFDLTSVTPEQNAVLTSLFQKEINLIKEWKEEGLLSQDIWSYSQDDVNYLMKHKPMPVVFMSLSQHRTVDQKSIQNYQSIPELSGETLTYFPSAIPTPKRSMIAPVTAIVPLSQDKYVDSTVRYLMNPSTQESLGNRTGMAPVLAKVNAGDLQSDDARYWVAATQGALMPLAEECFVNENQRKCFVNVVFGGIK